MYWWSVVEIIVRYIIMSLQTYNVSNFLIGLCSTSSMMQVDIAKFSVTLFKPKSFNRNIHIPPVATLIIVVLLYKKSPSRVIFRSYKSMINCSGIPMHLQYARKFCSTYVFWINYYRKCLSSLILKMLLCSFFSA